MQKKGLIILWLWMMAAILFIDYDLGTEAEYLNPWFLVMELSGNSAPGPYIYGQEGLGALAKPAALIAWVLEGALATYLLLIVLRGVHRIVNKG